MDGSANGSVVASSAGPAPIGRGKKTERAQASGRRRLLRGSGGRDAGGAGFGEAGRAPGPPRALGRGDRPFFFFPGAGGALTTTWFRERRCALRGRDGSTGEPRRPGPLLEWRRLIDGQKSRRVHERRGRKGAEGPTARKVFITGITDPANRGGPSWSRSTTGGAFALAQGRSAVEGSRRRPKRDFEALKFSCERRPPAWWPDARPAPNKREEPSGSRFIPVPPTLEGGALHGVRGGGER